MTLLTFGETALRFSAVGREPLRTAGETTVHAHGVESTAAVAAAAVGGDAVWLSKLPDTPLGRRVVAGIRAHGVDTPVVWTEDGRQGLTFSEAASPPREGRTLQDRAGTAVETVEPGDLPMGTVREAGAVFVGTNTAALSEAAADTAEAVFGAAQGTGAVTATDISPGSGPVSAADAATAFRRLADDVDVLFANEDELERTLDVAGGGRELATTVAAEYGLELVVVTRSERGAVALHDGPGTTVVHERTAVEVDTVDPTGGHAALVGVFLQRLLDGADADDALSHAVAAGSLARTVPGPLLAVDRAEVERVAESVADASR